MEKCQTTTLSDFLSPEHKASLSTDNAKGAWTGERFVNSLKDNREVWYDGQLIDVTSHPSFTGMLNTLAGLYEQQHTDQNSEKMLWRPEGEDYLASYSYLAPVNQNELDLKWQNSRLWMEMSHGQLPRIPDFMSNVIVGLYDFHKELAKINEQFAQNACDYYHYCRAHDICLTHALGDPQIDRSASPIDNPEHALRVVEKRADGIVVHGAKQLATLAPYCHEALIYLSPSFYMRDSPEHVAWFSVPIDTKGLKLLCRESHAESNNSFNHTFSNNYDEQDSMLFFDHVFIPINRVFLLEETQTAAKGFYELNKWSLYVGQIRFYYRLRTFLGIASLVAKSIGVNEFREITNRLGELTSYVELTRLGLVAVNTESKITQSGLLAPGSTLAMDAFASQIATRINEIIRQIGGSGIIMQPSKNDLANPQLRPYLTTYMKGKDVEVDFKAALFRLAFELVAERFGSRQELYEIWNRGDIVRTRTTLYNTYFDLLQCEQDIKAIISPPNK